jgi:hypothetical protein
MKRLSLFLLIILPVVAAGQKGFIATDSVTTAGLRVSDNGKAMNSIECQVKFGPRIKKYTPEEISEYGINRDLRYKSFKVGSGDGAKKYFLLSVIKDPNIYFLKLAGQNPRFFVASDDKTTITEIPALKDEYIPFLKNILPDCEYSEKNIKRLKLKINPLKRYFNDARICTGNPFPRVRYSLFGGYSFGTITEDMSAVLPGVPEKLNNSFVTFGVAADFPLYPGNMSFHPGIFFKQTGVSVTTYDTDNRFDLKVNYSNIVVPLLLRYTLYNKTISPYLEAGPLVAQTLKNDATITRSDRYSEIAGSVMDTEVIAGTLPGFGAGIGAILNYGSNISFFAGVNYYRIFHIQSMNKYFNFGDIALTAGILF